MTYYLRPHHSADFDFNNKNAMMYGIPLLVFILFILILQYGYKHVKPMWAQAQGDATKLNWMKVLAAAAVSAVVAYGIMYYAQQMKMM